ncbi:MAG: cobalamin biosynthesis protein CobG [Paracoccaceae bacterium]
MSRPKAQGWCPTAFHPMMSGDGMLLRVRPQFNRLSLDQALGLCKIAEQFGNGLIDFTSRAAVQIRGLTPASFAKAFSALQSLSLVSQTASHEALRGVLLSPEWQENDLTHRLTQALYDRLDELPELPAKFGFAIDTGRLPVLQSCSADIRLETSKDGRLLLIEDGADFGLSVSQDTAISALISLAHRFSKAVRGSKPNTRIKNLPLPLQSGQDEHATKRQVSGAALPLGRTALGFHLAPAFGQTTSQDFTKLLIQSDCKFLRLTPWRGLLLERVSELSIPPDFISDEHDPKRRIQVCPGAPACQSAKGNTRGFAAQIAPRLAANPALNSKELHISGCAKGCAKPQKADLTFVAQNRGFDLIVKGHAWDMPIKTGLDPDIILQNLDGF